VAEACGSRTKKRTYKAPVSAALQHTLPANWNKCNTANSNPRRAPFRRRGNRNAPNGTHGKEALNFGSQ